MEIEINNLSKKYRGFALENITFPVHEGYITGIVGKNGAGKTTLFRMLTIDNPGYTGLVTADGRDICENRQEYMNRTGFISDERYMCKGLSLDGNFKMLQTLYYDMDEAMFRKQCDEFELDRENIIKSLSRGELLRYQLALELSHHADFLILDEVTAGMDPVFRRDFFKILHKLLENEKMTILMSTHIMEELELHMDFVVRLENGRVEEFREVQG